MSVLDEQADRSLFLAPPPAPEATQARPEPSAGPAAPLADVEGGRRRWLGVAVVLALLVAGAVANRSNADRPGQPAVEAPGSGERVASRPALLPPSLRTNERAGPLLPEPTGTALVLAAGTQVVVVDVDTGTVRSVQAADLEVRSGYPSGAQVLAVGDSLVVRGEPLRAKVVPRADGGAVRDLTAGSGGGLHPSQVPGRLFVEELRGDPRLLEVDLSGAVHRTIALDVGTEAIVWDGRSFLVSVDGRTARVADDAGGREPVAAGLAVAADEATVALLHCQGASRDGCPLTLLDRASGTGRPVAAPAGIDGFRAGAGASLSPDGRWLLVEAVNRAGTGLALVEVAAGAVRTVELADTGTVRVGTFSPDGRWLFVGTGVGSVTAELDAVRLADGARVDIALDLSMRTGFGLVLEAVPAVPADAGS